MVRYIVLKTEKVCDGFMTLKGKLAMEQKIDFSDEDVIAHILGIPRK